MSIDCVNSDHFTTAAYKKNTISRRCHASVEKCVCKKGASRNCELASRSKNSKNHSFVSLDDGVSLSNDSVRGLQP